MRKTSYLLHQSLTIIHIVTGRGLREVENVTLSLLVVIQVINALSTSCAMNRETEEWEQWSLGTVSLFYPNHPCVRGVYPPALMAQKN